MLVYFGVLGVSLRLGPGMYLLVLLFLLNLLQNVRQKAAINRHTFSSLLLHNLHELLSRYVHHLESLYELLFPHCAAFSIL